jgi:hypothetical protein
MRTPTNYNGERVTVYALELCHYGDRGDYEVFPYRELAVDIEKRAERLAAEGYELDYLSSEVVIFRRGETEYTAYPDGRLIIENLEPGSTEQATEAAAAIWGYESRCP